jgi:hypothetical protein
MKRLFLPVLAAFVAMASSSCNSNAGKKEDTAGMSKDSAELVQTTTVDMQVKPSDDHFLAALDAFTKKENAVCAKHIQEGINAFKKETAPDTGKTKLMAEAAMKNLEGLDEKVEKGEVKNIDVLDNAFTKAEDVNTHRMFVMISDLIIPEKPDAATKANFSKALGKIKTSVAKDKSRMKADGEKMIKKGEAIEKKLNSDTKATEQEMKEFNNWAKNWLETHI